MFPTWDVGLRLWLNGNTRRSSMVERRFRVYLMPIH